MPGLDGTPHLGARRHIRIAAEDNYGVVADTPSWHPVPILEDGMKVKATNPRYRPDTNYGGDYRRHVHVAHKMDVSGNILTLPWPEVTALLLGMALNRAANHDLAASYTIDHFTPVDPRRYLGCVADSLTIAATGMGEADVRLTLGMIAKLEEENDAIDEEDFDYSGITPVPFMFRDAAIRILTVHRIDVEAFTITVQNGVAPGPNVQTAGNLLGTIAYAIAQQRAISLELTKVNRDDVFNELIRDGGWASFEVNFTHPDGHVWQIQLPAIYTEGSDEDGTPSQLAKENPTFEVGVDDGGCDIIWAVDLGPEASTTTLAGLTTTAAA